MGNEFQVGAASVPISPDQPQFLKVTALHGHWQTAGVLKGFEQHADAMAFRAGEQTAVVATFDTGGLGVTFDKELRKAISEKTGVDEKWVLLGGRHNHSSGAAQADPKDPRCKEAVDAYSRKIREGIVEACAKAVADLKPAEIAVRTATLAAPVGQNRRTRFGHGAVMEGWGSGPVAVPGEKFAPPPGGDSGRIDFLCARRVGEKRPFALFTSYASHIHLAAIPYFNSELAGGVKNALRSRLGDVTLVYANVNGADNALQCTFPIPPGGDDVLLKWYRDSMEKLGNRFADAIAEALPQDGYARPTELAVERFSTDGQDPRENRIYQIAGLRLGSIAILTIPSELFLEYVDRIREESPVRDLLLSGFNGSSRLFYIAPPLAFEQGGYETAGGPAPSPEEERKMLAEGVQSLHIGAARMDTGEEIVRNAAKVLKKLSTRSE